MVSLIQKISSEKNSCEILIYDQNEKKRIKTLTVTPAHRKPGFLCTCRIMKKGPAKNNKKTKKTKKIERNATCS